MRRLLGGILGVACGIVGVSALLSMPVRAEGDAIAGERAAVEWCARCHVIGDQNKYGGINSTPSFWIMAEKPQTYSAKLLTFQERRPHRALKFDVTQDDVENIHAYVATLKRE